MLPKPDKSKKPISEQLDLVTPLDNEKKLRRQRRVVLFTLLFSAGLSLCFWFYRFLPKFSLPAGRQVFLLPKPNPIPSNYQNWSIYLRANNSVWSQNFTQDPKDLINALFPLKPSENNLLKDILPSGVEIKEILASTSASYQISVPNQTIILLLRFPPGEKLRLPTLVEKIYWTLVKS